MSRNHCTSETSIKNSDFYKIEVNAPSPGNPIFTVDRQLSSRAPSLVSTPKTKDPLNKQQHPMYVTSSSSYGELQPTEETSVNNFKGKSQRFSEHLDKSGMYRNYSLNTVTNKSRV